MKILAIDTTTKKAAVALKTDKGIYKKEIDNEITHSEKLLPIIHELLSDTNTSLNEIDLLCTTLGPGSFTGVRIGIATIKAIAKVINKKIYGITSLELLAYDGIAKSSSVPEYVLSLIDARNNRAYYELYKYANNSLTSLEFSGNDYIDNIINELNSMNLEKLLIVSDKEVADNTNAQIANLDLTHIFNLDLNCNLYDYLNLDAIYYRKSEAERTVEGE